MINFIDFPSDIAERTKDYKVGKNIIVSCLKNSNYAENFEEITTFLEPDKTRWGRGKRSYFEDELQNKGYMHFAYIKFYLGDDKKQYALVGGKTGSRKVNASGTDVYFSYNTAKGESKKWLVKNDKKWHTTSIIIIKTFSKKDEESRKEAFEIEKDICRVFSLMES